MQPDFHVSGEQLQISKANPVDKFSFLLVVLDNKAAVKIQSRWRGYWARKNDPNVLTVCYELRARRSQDHILQLTNKTEK